MFIDCSTTGSSLDNLMCLAAPQYWRVHVHNFQDNLYYHTFIYIRIIHTHFITHNIHRPQTIHIALDNKQQSLAKL